MLFNLYVSVSAVYVTVRAIVIISYCFTEDCIPFQSFVAKGVGIAACVICFMFALFTSVMFVDQIWMKYNATSTIE